MITVKQIEDLVELARMPDDSAFLKVLGFKNFVSEFRTVGIKAPRRTGKTTAVKKFIEDKSALYIDGNSADRVLSKNYIGLRSDMSFSGLKFQYIVVDETNKITEDQFSEFLVNLASANMLTSDFRVIVIGT